MSVDTVLSALSDFQCVFTRSDVLTIDERAKLNLSVSTLREPLLKEDVAGFDSCVDNGLRHYPDRYDFLLGELFQLLHINTRDELSALLAA